MKYITFTFLTFFLTAISCSSNAQSFYLKFGAGYSFPLAPYSLGEKSFDIEHLETDPETGYYVFTGFEAAEDEVKGSFNSGIASSATIGYLFSPHIGVEVSVGYMFGRTYSILSEQKQILDGNQIRHSSSASTSWNSTNAFAVPSLVLTTGNGVLRPYVSAGPILALVKIDEKKQHFSDYDGTPDLTRQEERYSGGISLGVRGTAGLDVRLNRTISLFSEVAFVGMSYHPKQKETLKYEVNGQDEVPLWPVSQRKVSYVKKTAINTSGPDNPSNGSDKPRKELRTYFGVSSLSAMAGIKLLL